MAEVREGTEGAVRAYLSFILQFCPPVPEEKPLRARFTEIGIEGGKPFCQQAPDAQKAET